MGWVTGKNVAWMPRSGLEQMEHLIWLPRLFDKARRAERSQSGRLCDGYCYGNNDFIDGRVLHFLRTDDVTVASILRSHSDEEAARIIVHQSGRTRDECAQFSRSLRRQFQNFALLEADEGRLTGIKSILLRFFYNRMMMPVVYSVFRRAEQKRRGVSF